MPDDLSPKKRLTLTYETSMTDRRIDTGALINGVLGLVLGIVGAAFLVPVVLKYYISNTPPDKILLGLGVVVGAIGCLMVSTRRDFGFAAKSIVGIGGVAINRLRAGRSVETQTDAGDAVTIEPRAATLPPERRTMLGAVKREAFSTYSQPAVPPQPPGNPDPPRGGE